MKNSIILSLVFPILLIHGYGEDAHVWDQWVKWLKSDHITNVKAVTFSNNDKCGSVKQHAIDLENQVNTTVNIVAHSKGGLDARWYVAHSSIDKVANLIMIATPNLGTTAAYMDLTTCAGAAGFEDLQPNSNATQSADKTTKTHYYTVAGNYAAPCYFVIMRSTCYLEENDGLVTVSSVQSNYSNLGVFPYNHTGLLTHPSVYEKVLPIL